MADVFIALGSNLGDRGGNLAAARKALASGGIERLVASSIYDTQPWGPVKQGRYLNQVVRGATELVPHELLAKLQEIERSLGRDRTQEERFGPRNIDLDILLYDGLEIQDADLTIPHPRMKERAFVLIPLVEIAPAIEIGGVAATDLLARIDRSAVAISRQSA